MNELDAYWFAAAVWCSLMALRVGEMYFVVLNAACAAIAVYMGLT